MSKNARESAARATFAAMLLVAHFSRRLKETRGAAALEAMLSIVLLFVAFYCMWGVALVIYNQSRLNTASQLAAQSALVVFDRSTYRGLDPDGKTYSAAFNRAARVAWSVYRENTCGMLPDQFSGEDPATGCEAPAGQQPPNFAMTIQCSGLLTAGYTTQNCQSGGLPNADALRVRVQGSVISPFDLLSPLNSLGADHSERRAMLQSSADAYSFAATGKIR